MGKLRQGLNRPQATMQRTVLFNLTQEFYPAQTLQVKIAKSAFFHNFALFQVNKCPIYGANGDRA